MSFDIWCILQLGGDHIKSDRIEKIKLVEAADITSGVVLKRFSRSKKSVSVPSKETSVKHSKYCHITIKSVEEDNIDLKLIEEIAIERDIDEKYLLNKGDIVMKLVPPYSSAVVDFECANLVAPSNFAIIRAKHGFDSNYLASILNGKNVNRQLQRLVQGSSLPIIKISDLKELEISFRSNKEQKMYAELYTLLRKRLRLRNRVLRIEEQLTKDFLSDMENK